ncbi:hypothetical protein D3C78_1003520 [compost metagenome]
MQIRDVDNQSGICGIAITVAQGEQELVLPIPMNILGLIVVLPGFKVQYQLAVGGIERQLGAIDHLVVGRTVMDEDAALGLVIEVGAVIVGQALHPFALDRLQGDITLQLTRHRLRQDADDIGIIFYPNRSTILAGQWVQVLE